MNGLGRFSFVVETWFWGVSLWQNALCEHLSNANVVGDSLGDEIDALSGGVDAGKGFILIGEGVRLSSGLRKLVASVKNPLT